MRLVTIKEISRILNVKVSTLYSWVNKGSIPAHKINGLIRFDMDEIEEWVKRSRQASCKATAPAIKVSNNQDIDSIIKKAIDDVTGKRYNSSIGKPGPRQGLRKEVKDGTL